MGRPDPFFAYSLLLRVIVFGFIPAFAVLQYFRLRRGLHVFQLEGYRAGPFLAWCRQHPRRALWLRQHAQKKPLVMTGRAWRILAAALALSVAASLALPGFAHLLLGGWPADVTTWAVVTSALFAGSPLLLVAADRLLAPVQAAINRAYRTRAETKLAEVSPVVVGITGSFGKTSTRAVVEKLIAPPGSALATPESFNTPLGVIRTINERLEPRHRFLVVEMGARREGDIAELCRLVRPRIGVLTAIGPAHVETFGSIQAVTRAKHELIESLPRGGVAVMNVDDAIVRRLAAVDGDRKVVRFGLDRDGNPDVTATDVATTTSGSRLTIIDRCRSDELTVTTRLLGRHSLGHVLAGVAVALAVGRRLGELGEAIESLEPVEHRLQLIEGAGGVTVIDDAYNSNPDGSAAALDVLAALPARRRVVVTPGIVELGDMQSAANEGFGYRAARVADALVVVARVNREAIIAGALRAGTSTRLVTVDSLAEAQAELASLVGPGDAVLFENDLPDHYEGR